MASDPIGCTFHSSAKFQDLQWGLLLRLNKHTPKKTRKSIFLYFLRMFDSGHLNSLTHRQVQVQEQSEQLVQVPRCQSATKFSQKFSLFWETLLSKNPSQIYVHVKNENFKTKLFPTDLSVFLFSVSEWKCTDTAGAQGWACDWCRASIILAFADWRGGRLLSCGGGGAARAFVIQELHCTVNWLSAAGFYCN